MRAPARRWIYRRTFTSVSCVSTREMKSYALQDDGFGISRTHASFSSSSSSGDDDDVDEDDDFFGARGHRRVGGAKKKTKGVPRIEIKPPSDGSGAANMSMPALSSFSFAPPPRAKMVGDGAANERASAGFSLGGDSAREVAFAAAASSAPERPPEMEDDTAKTLSSTTSRPPVRKPRAVLDPYDMLDAMVVGQPTKAKTKAPATKSSARAPSPASSAEYYPQGPISPRGVGASGPISPRGAGGGSSFAADSAFFEELAQISLPDSDTINPKREFARGLELFDANKLSEALFAFVAAAVNAVHSGDEVAIRCASYATACKILRDATTLSAGNPKECARLTRHLVVLPNIEERHRRASLRFASAKNFKAGNAGTAASMITTLISISPPETSASLYGMLKQCQDVGQNDVNVPEDEDASKMCAATLDSIPKSQNGMTCKQCGALHSTKAALETGQCVICRSSLTARTSPPSESWMW